MPRRIFGTRLLAPFAALLVHFSSAATVLAESVPESSPQKNDALQAYTSGNYDEAGRLFETHLESHPEDVEARGYLGNIFYHQGKLAEAEASYRKALRVQPEVLPWLFELAKLLKQTGNYKEASALFRKILGRSPAHHEARRHLRDCLVRLGQFSEAFLLNEELLKQAKISWQEGLQKGMLLLSGGKLMRARGELEKVLADEPDLFEARVALCSIYFALGEYWKCKPYLLGFKPEEVENLEFCLLEATTAFHKFLTRFPTARGLPV